MSALVVDIETVGVSWEDLPEGVGDYLMARERRRQGPMPSEQAIFEAANSSLGLSAGTGHIVAIGMRRLDLGQNYALLAAAENPENGDDTLGYMGDERGVLEAFWGAAQRASQIITFNGRSFDGPYLMHRSLIHGIKPLRNLVPYRYSFKEHCDLLEVLTFFGSSQRFSLDYWCKAFGIDSPKGSLDGASVAAAYRDGRLADIGRYCLADVEATAALYEKLKPAIVMQK